MALDEPKQDDDILDFGAYQLVFDPQVAGFITEKGGLAIDYVDEPARKGYLITLSAPGGECEGGSCSC